ncbi:MAG: hypothetical protein U0518_03835 [Candidatus Gracilibacteria bacterium]
MKFILLRLGHIFCGICSMIGLLSLSVAQAADTTYLGISKEDLRSGNITTDDIPKVIVSLINIVLALAGTISLIMIIYGAFQMVMGSYEQNVKGGKQTITYALIGLVISASSWFIIKFVFTSFV